MARPQKAGLDYFSHDTDASNDEKLEAMESSYGLAGHAFYFKLLERIYHQPNFELDISDAETIQILARKWRITVKTFNAMLETAVKWRLFDAGAYSSRRCLRSDGVQRRASTVVEKRDSMKRRYLDSKVEVSDAETIQKSDRNVAETIPPLIPLSPNNPLPPIVPLNKRKVKEKESKEERKKEVVGLLPDWIDKETWKDFLEMRKRLRASPTDKAIQLLIKDLENFKAGGDDPNKVLEQSIANSWRGLFPLKDKKGRDAGQSNPRKLPTRYTRPEEL